MSRHFGIIDFSELSTEMVYMALSGTRAETEKYESKAIDAAAAGERKAETIYIRYHQAGLAMLRVLRRILEFVETQYKEEDVE